MRRDWKAFDENCLYITQDECRLKHHLSVHFLRKYFTSQGLDGEESMQNLYERIALSNASDDYMIYVALEQSAAKSLAAELDKTAPCFILLKEGRQYEPESYYFIFYTTSKINRINAYLDRFGFYKVDVSGCFGGQPDKDAPGQAESETESDTVNAQDIPLNNTGEPPVANPAAHQADIENALHRGILTLPNNLYTLPESVREQMANDKLTASKVLMTESEWKKHGYTVTNNTAPLYLKNVPNAPEYLPLYDQNHVSRTEENAPLRDTERNAALQRSVIALQQMIRNNALMRDSIVHNPANIDNTREYTPENTQNKTAVELTRMIFAMLPSFVMMYSGEMQQQIGQYRSLAENSVKRALLNALSSVLGMENALEPLQSLVPDEKTLASDITKAAIPIPALLALVSRAAQGIAGTIQNAVSEQREESQTIERATLILADIPEETRGKIPLLNADNYRGKDNSITLTLADAKAILQAFTAHDKGLQKEVTRS